MVTIELLMLVGAFEDSTVAVVEQRDGGGTKFAGVLGDGPFVIAAVLDRCRRPCAS